MVKGMLMDTEDEMKRRPTARVNGFFSGLARLIMARKEDAVLLGSSPEVAMSLDNIVRFSFGDVCATSGFAGGSANFSSCEGLGVDESHLRRSGKTRGVNGGRSCRMCRALE